MTGQTLTEAPPLPAHAPGETVPARPLRAKLYNRMDGTWDRPAPFSNADDCVTFWSTVEIPEGLPAYADKALKVAIKAEIESGVKAATEAWRKGWLVEHPEPKKARDKEVWEAAYQAEFGAQHAAVTSQLTAKNPSMSFYDIPQILRAARMFSLRPTGRFSDEGAKVLAEPIELTHEVLTVSEIESKYRIDRIWDQVWSYQPVHPLAGSLQKVGDQIDALHNELNSARGTLIDIERSLEN